MHGEKDERKSPNGSRELLTKEILLDQAKSGGKLSMLAGVGLLVVAAIMLLTGGVGLDALEGLLALGFTALVAAGAVYMLRSGMDESRGGEAQLARGRFWLVEDVALRKRGDQDPDDDSPTSYYYVCGKSTV